MIHFACPGCGCPHTSSDEFGGLDAKCIRCGAVLQVPKAPPRPALKSARKAEARQRLASRPLPSRGQPRSAPPRFAPPVPELEPEPPMAEPELLDPEPPADPVPPPPRKKPERKGAKEWFAHVRAWAFLHRKRVIPAAIGVVVLLVAVALLTSGKSKKPVPTPPAPAREPDDEPPPPKKDPPPPPPPPPPPALPEAPPPRLVRDVVPGEWTAAAFLAERDDDAVRFDRDFGGKVVTIRGTYSPGSAAQFGLCDNPNRIGEIPCTLQGAAIPTGMMARLDPPPPLVPGQPITVRGVYTGGPKLDECVIVRTTSAADTAFRGRPVVLAGEVEQVGGDALYFRLRAGTSDCPVIVLCYFRPSRANEVKQLQFAEKVVVQGMCAGRQFRIIRLDDCRFLRPGDEANPAATALTAERFYALYEVDLLPFERPKLGVPALPVAADKLAAAFEADRRAGSAAYRGKLVEVSGRIVNRNPANHTITFEVGTTQKLGVEAAFTAEKYRAVRPDDTTVTVRGVCAGVRAGSVRVENAEVHDPDSANPASRLVADYFPFKPGRELSYDLLTFVPGKVKDFPITRMSVKFGNPDQIVFTQLKAGTYPGNSLFVNSPAEPKWTRDLTKLKTPPQPVVAHYRLTEDTVEIAQSLRPGERTPFWEPILRLGARQGGQWSVQSPDGRTIEYTVLEYRKDGAKQFVEVKRVSRATRPLDAGPNANDQWEETLITYQLGVGELKRSTTMKSANGTAAPLSEMRLTDAEAVVPADGK